MCGVVTRRRKNAIESNKNFEESAKGKEADDSESRSAGEREVK